MKTSTVSAPRLEDVARLAGVSLATASRVLNGSTRKVAESYRTKVLAAAAELGYTANLSAQATARGTSATIALLVADIADPYFSNIAAGVAARADEENIVVTIATTSRDADREAAVLGALRGQRPRAVILAASRATGNQAAGVEALLAGGSAVVALGPESGPTTSPGIQWVGVDNLGGARALGAAVSDLGYRNALILSARAGVRTSDDRVAGFTESFTAAGGRIVGHVECGFDREGGKAGMAAAISDGLIAPGESTLVFAISDVMAIGALRAIRTAGLRIGTDVGLAGFDDITTATDVTPELTTVFIPLSDLGYRAAAIAIGSDEAGAGEDPLQLRVVLRESTPRVAAQNG